MSRRVSAMRAVLAVCVVGLAGCGVGHRYSRAARSGVRVGYGSYSTFDVREIDGRPMIGLYYRPSVSFPSVLEIGLDVVADPEQPEARYMLMARAALCYYPTRSHLVYFVVGGGGVQETYATIENTGGFAEAGIGHRRKMLGSELDLRVVYQGLVNSENAHDVVMATVGMSF